MRPIVINYASSNTTYIANTQTAIANVPLILNYNNWSSNLNIGTTTPSVLLPRNQTRQLVILTNLTGVQEATVQIKGTNFFGQSLSETVNLGDVPKYSFNGYTQVNSVTPLTVVSGMTMSIGYANAGFTNLFPLDAYNKSQSYNFSIMNPGAGSSTLNFYLAYTVEDIYTTQNGQVIPNQNLDIQINQDLGTVNVYPNYFLFPLNNDNVIISATSGVTTTSWPITLNPDDSISLNSFGIPLTGVTAYMGSDAVDTYTPAQLITLTVLQQGGKF